VAPCGVRPAAGLRVAGDTNVATSTLGGPRLGVQIDAWIDEQYRSLPDEEGTRYLPPRDERNPDETDIVQGYVTRLRSRGHPLTLTKPQENATSTTRGRQLDKLLRSRLKVVVIGVWAVFLVTAWIAFRIK
jgi:hypothetical protein